MYILFHIQKGLHTHRDILNIILWFIVCKSRSLTVLIIVFLEEDKFFKSQEWMPWVKKQMKDVIGCEKLR